MAAEGSAYEHRIWRLVKNLLEHKNSKGWVTLEEPGWGRENLWIGASGAKHQIDVSVRFRTPDGSKRLWLAESKNWESRASLPPSPVLCFLARVYDIWQKEQDSCDHVEAHMFAPKGYGPNAKRIAQHYGIGMSFSNTDGTDIRIAETVNTFRAAKTAEAQAAALAPDVTTTKCKAQSVESEHE